MGIQIYIYIHTHTHDMMPGRGVSDIAQTAQAISLIYIHTNVCMYVCLYVCQGEAFQILRKRLKGVPTVGLLCLAATNARLPTVATEATDGVADAGWW